ncbi:TIGR03086 family metal-binding protein [Embleya scabrispora]|uniref:TIGR03086 family metal-binding protein n=1 Tax=Embleya scabrispora TaxID=159449 RepID=UPI0003626EB4|nr:TIGR03086 family metal-binding protein [Embleya scabrispora]MYS84876.1 TIGR03086 family protein [Streptomyces sp. SID5474]
MTETISELLRHASRAAVAVVGGIRDDELRLPTPCDAYEVGDLLNHLFQVVVNFQALAAKESADFSTTPDHLHGDWRAGFEAETARLVAAWSMPGADEGISGGMGLPAGIVARMALLDLTVHAWDLARATGRDYTPPSQVIPALNELVDTMATTARTMNVFAAPVPTPEDAPPFEALLAHTGRDPRWNSATATR